MLLDWVLYPISCFHLSIRSIETHLKYIADTIMTITNIRECEAMEHINTSPFTHSIMRVLHTIALGLQNLSTFSRVKSCPNNLSICLDSFSSFLGATFLLVISFIIQVMTHAWCNRDYTMQKDLCLQCLIKGFNYFFCQCKKVDFFHSTGTQIHNSISKERNRLKKISALICANTIFKII